MDVVEVQSVVRNLLAHQRRSLIADAVTAASVGKQCRRRSRRCVQSIAQMVEGISMNSGRILVHQRSSPHRLCSNKVVDTAVDTEPTKSRSRVAAATATRMVV